MLCDRVDKSQSSVCTPFGDHFFASSSEALFCPVCRAFYGVFWVMCDGMYRIVGEGRVISRVSPVQVLLEPISRLDFCPFCDM